MSRLGEKVYYVWRAHMEGVDCNVLSFSGHDGDGVRTMGKLEDVANFACSDIRAIPASKSQTTNFGIKTISGPDIILRPRVFDGEYINHSLVCRRPLSVEEMIQLSDLIHEQLREVRKVR